MKRIIDVVLVLIALPFALLASIVIAIAIKLDSPGPIIYWSERIGRNSQPFLMPKFRSMRVDAPVIEAEKFSDAKNYISRVGAFLRKTSLDEIPQLWCVLTPLRRDS